MLKVKDVFALDQGLRRLLSQKILAASKTKGKAIKIETLPLTSVKTITI
jgi:hypothetical protein